MRKIAVAMAMGAFFAGKLYAAPAGYPINNTAHDFTAGNNGGYIGSGGTPYTSENKCTTCHAAHKAKRNFPLWSRDTPDATNWAVWRGGYKANAITLNGKVDGVTLLGSLDPNLPKANWPSHALDGLADSNITDQGGSDYWDRTYVKAVDLVAGGTGLCMSCHDGTLALVSNTGGIESSNNPPGEDGTYTLNGAHMDPNARQMWGTDLRDMHPVGIEVPWGKTGWQASLNVGNSASGSNVVTETNGAVGCTSCHSMHSSQVTGNMYLDMRLLRKGERCLSCHDK